MLIVLSLACAEEAPDPAAPLPTEGTLSVLTYNVQGLPEVLTDNGRPTGERMDRIAPMLEAFDLVGVQEDFDAGFHDRLVGSAGHPVSVWFDDVVSSERVYGAGLALLARGAGQVAYDETHYDDCNGVFDGSSDCLASKGFQRLTLDLGGGLEVDVYNTHHEAGGGEDDDAARGAQVQQVLASFDGASAGRAVVFMGDTNLRWSDPEDVDELQAYADAGLRDACDEVDCPDDDHIDRFLVRDSDDVALTVDLWAHDTSFVDEDGQDLSDHPAIVMELSWARR